MKLTEMARRYNETTDSMEPIDLNELDLIDLLDMLADYADYQETCFDSIGEPSTDIGAKYWHDIRIATRTLQGLLRR